MVAVALVTVILVAAGYIFQTSVAAVSTSQANSEMNLSLDSFGAALRADVKALESDGFLVMGRRSRQGFCSQRDRTMDFERTVRNDWITFYLNTETMPGVDPRGVGQWTRVFYGHGPAANPDPANSKRSELAFNWVLMRYPVAMIPKGWTDPFTGTLKYLLVADNMSAGYETRGIEQSTDDRGLHYMLETYRNRSFNWWRWRWDAQPPAHPSTPWIDEMNESTFYLQYFSGNSYYGRGRHVLPHCASFQVQYAMADDLAAGPGGGVRWQDPPTDGESVADPNYNANDWAHSAQQITDGRILFAPGDAWPVLLKFTAHVVDPMDRLIGGRKVEVVVRVP